MEVENKELEELLKTNLGDFVGTGGPMTARYSRKSACLTTQEWSTLKDAGFKILSDIASLTFSEFRKRVKYNIHLQASAEKVLAKNGLAFKK
jgi:hypothetical protein